MQLTFDAFDHARTTDPNTSKLAAERLGFAESHCGRILQALPGTIDMIAEKTGLTNVQVARRTADLEKAGLATTCGTRLSKAGRLERVWVRT